ncbi:MAG: hypothetical protein WAK24_14970 [Candidatus Acidiferrales bacterium]
MLRILHSRSAAEAGTEAVAAVVPMEVEAEAASTVAAVVVADTMEAEAAERIAAVAVVRTAAVDRRVILLEAWVRMDAAAAVMRRVDTAAGHMAVGVPTVRTAGRDPMALTVAAAPMERTEAGQAEARRQTQGTAAQDRVRGVRIL